MCIFEPCDQRTVDLTALKDAQFDENVNQIDSVFGGFLQELKIPGGAVGIIRNNEIVVLRGLGLASISPYREFTVGTPGLVGSVSKTLTALGVLVLREKNLISLSASINKYLPVPMPEYDDITIPQLLSHTSGIDNHGPDFGTPFLGNDEEDLKNLCGFNLDPPLQHVCADPNHPGIHPRSAYYTYFMNNTFAEAAKNGDYSNINYMLLGTIIDMVTRDKTTFGSASGYENFIWHHVLFEAEMLSPCLMADWRNIHNLARGYKLSPQDDIPTAMAVPYPDFLWGWEGPAGGWTMTIGDLCRLMIGINLNRVISQIYRDKILLARVSNDLKVLELAAPYGSGVFLFDDNNNGKGYLHHGDIDGFTARFTYYQSHDVGVALMFNCQSVKKQRIGELSIELRDLFASVDQGAIPARPIVDRSPSAVARLLREYDSEIVHFIKQVSFGAVAAGRGEQALARYLIGTQGERGKQLLRHIKGHNYEKAAEIVLHILEDQQPRPIDRPDDWV